MTQCADLRRHESRARRPPGRPLQEDTISKFDNDKIQVFTQPGCGPCISVLRHLKKGLSPELHESQVEIYNVQEDEEAADRVRSFGYVGTPVTFFRGDHFHKYRPDLLDGYIGAVKTENPSAA